VVTIFVQNNQIQGKEHGARICLLTQRYFRFAVARAALYEFEDVIREIDAVDMIVPKNYPWFSLGQRLVNRAGRHVSSAFGRLNPGLQKIRLEKKYDLFFAIVLVARDLLSLNAIEGWRQRCQTAICWIDEFWAGEIHKYKSLLKILSKFDYVLTNCSGSVQAIQDAINRPCFYIMPGIDAIKFCPYPEPPVRSIDVYNMGRRAPVTHQKLLKMAGQNKIFYMYDTIHSGDMHPPNPSEHRSLIANILKRSRYLLANTAKIDRPFETHGQIEIGYRFYEGAAAGAVMIGEVPDNRMFHKEFDWPNAVIPMNFDSDNVDKILADLDAQPQLIKEISRNSVINVLDQGDWAYSWEKILGIAGLESMPALEARKKVLKRLAMLAKASCDETPSIMANARS
jgi:hypothetical protein